MTRASMWAPNSDWLCPGHSHLSGHSSNYARSFNQSDDRNLPMRYIIVINSLHQFVIVSRFFFFAYGRCLVSKGALQMALVRSRMFTGQWLWQNTGQNLSYKPTVFAALVTCIRPCMVFQFLKLYLKTHFGK